MKLTLSSETWPMQAAAGIAGTSFEDAPTLLVTLEDGGAVGRGEASGVYYRGETIAELTAQIERVRREIEAGLTFDKLHALLPAGGARNALDCALWDLEAERAAVPVWRHAGLGSVRPILTTRTVFAGDPFEMAHDARQLGDAPLVKTKLLGDDRDAERVRHVHAARPDARMVIDANQALDLARYEALLPVFEACNVIFIEQPFPVGRETWLDACARPLPIAADESVQDRADLALAREHFDIVNIKLDKCGGLSEAMAMAKEAKRLGLGVMVGCMLGTSLAIRPAFVAAQFSDFADVDAPLYLARDRIPSVRYENFHLIVDDDRRNGSAP